MAMTTDETIVLRALELGLALAEEKLLYMDPLHDGRGAVDMAEADVRDIKYAIRLVEAWK